MALLGPGPLNPQRGLLLAPFQFPLLGWIHVTHSLRLEDLWLLTRGFFGMAGRALPGLQLRQHFGQRNVARLQ